MYYFLWCLIKVQKVIVRARIAWVDLQRWRLRRV